MISMHSLSLEQVICFKPFVKLWDKSCKWIWKLHEKHLVGLEGFKNAKLSNQVSHLKALQFLNFESLHFGVIANRRWRCENRYSYSKLWWEQYLRYPNSEQSRWRTQSIHFQIGIYFTNTFNFQGGSFAELDAQDLQS